MHYQWIFIRKIIISKMFLSLLIFFINDLNFCFATKQRAGLTRILCVDIWNSESENWLKYLQIRWPRVSFKEAHGDRDPIRSIQQKENIENMARLVTACFGLYTEEQCLVSLFDSDYFWNWNKKVSVKAMLVAWSWWQNFESKNFRSWWSLCQKIVNVGDRNGQNGH